MLEKANAVIVEKQQEIEELINCERIPSIWMEWKHCPLLTGV